MSNLEAVKRYQAKNKAKIVVARRLREESNPEHAKELRRKHNLAWRVSHPGDSVRRMKEWMKKNPEKWRESNRRAVAAYKLRNKNAAKEHVRARNLRMRGLSGHHTLAEWLFLCSSMFFGRCACCLAKTDLTRDHIIPITVSGSSDDITNIQPLCRACNASKGTKTIDYRGDFFERLMESL